MGRGDTQGRDSSSPAMCGLLCGRGWLACLLDHFFAELWQLRPSVLKQHRRAIMQLSTTPVMAMSWDAWRHAGARFLLSGGVWPVVWPWLAGVSTRPFLRGAVAAEAIRSETTSAGDHAIVNNPGHGHVMGCVETRRGSIPPLRRCVACCVAVVGWCVYSTISSWSCGS